MPTLGNVAAKTALPHPPRTSQKVPKNSAPYFFIRSSFALLIVLPNIELTGHRKGCPKDRDTKPFEKAAQVGQSGSDWLYGLP